jgi:hypothetical protein
VRIGFWDYWQKQELGNIGYPISGAYLDEASGLIVQLFEKTRLEYHPEATDAFKIMRGNLGDEIAGYYTKP